MGIIYLGISTPDKMEEGKIVFRRLCILYDKTDKYDNRRGSFGRTIDKKIKQELSCDLSDGGNPQCQN